ncbi:MAG TPA: DUF2071 domain-containing protein [Chitinophagaceae bacterium]|nr:DUF2071 domain-containing protein [Chitinophagaceae bacterium]
MRRVFLSAEWRKLAIANYSIDEKVLLPYLPYRTELDRWNGECYVSLVGFRFINTKLKGIPVPFHRHFEEINLRFYVRFREDGKWKRGVTFIREIVPKPALTFVANTIYKEKYITLPTRYQWQEANGRLQVAYQWKHLKRWNTFSVTAENAAREMDPGSKAEFITEHYWGYAPVHAAGCTEYEVSHPRWQEYKVLDSSIDVSFEKLYGPAFSCLDGVKPRSVMLAEGSEICVYGKKSIR